MEQELKKLLEDWQERRQLTLDLLDELPEEHLYFTVDKNMKTIAEQYKNIGDVQICYNEAIKTGKADFSKMKKDYSLKTSKEKLKAFLEEVNQETLKLAEENPNVKIDWFGEEHDIREHIRVLIEHEILHHRELAVYIKALGLKFPKSWEVLGL